MNRIIAITYYTALKKKVKVNGSYVKNTTKDIDIV